MKLFSRPYLFVGVAATAFFAEIALLTFWQGRLGPHISAVVFFLASMAVGAAGLWLSQVKYANPEPAFTYRGRWHSMPLLFLYLLFVGFAFYLVSGIIATEDISPAHSDIIPQTEVLVQRFRQEQFPYQTISDWGYDLFPTYQPLQWLPFVPAARLQVDFRLWALLILLLAIGVFTAFTITRKTVKRTHYVLVPLLFIPLLAVGLYLPTVFTRTLENLVAAYYLLLCAALLSRSVLFLGAALLLCLLSRYGIIVWLPLFLFLLLFSGRYKKAIALLLFCTAGVMLFYVLPFLLKDPGIFWKGYQYHTAAALAEWSGQSWQQPGDKPFQLFRGIGLAGLFYDHHNGSTAEKLRLFQWLHLGLCGATALGLASLFHRYRHRISLPVFALGSLKLVLSVFYHFIQIPYDYLFLTLLYVSIPVVWLAAETLQGSRSGLELD